MTKEEALALLRSASRTDKPCRINRNLTESQAVGIIEACVIKYADGKILHDTLEKRVRQMLVPINAKETKITELQSTITTQADMIQRLKEDGERLAKSWWESHNDETISCQYCGLQQSNFENNHKDDCPITLHTALMAELEKREG